MDIEKNEQAILYHKTVMVEEVLSYLHLEPDKRYCDVTFGSGGHTKAILNAESKCSVIALDWDAESIETYAPRLEEHYGERLSFLWGNFAHIYHLFKKAKIDGVDGIIADFGTSQMHIKERSGFSVYIDSPLDMRMSPAHQRVTAEQVIHTSSEEKLREMFWQLGQEAEAKKIARAIVEERQKKRIRTTFDLVKVIERIVPRRHGVKIHPATKVFQALRMYVNHELENIHSFLSGALKVLRPGGRLLCISFHSLEDSVVKQFFKEHAAKGEIEIVTKKVVTPTAEEIARNPSARSAKLRVACKIGDVP